MDFKARVYETEAAQLVAYERLQHLFAKLDPSTCRQLIRAFAGDEGELPVIIVGFEDETAIARIKRGHWVGGDEHPLPNDIKAALEKQFLRTAGQTPDDEDSLVVQTFPPGHLLHEDGDVGPPA